MAQTNIDSITGKEINKSIENVGKIFNSEGLLEYKTAITQLFAILGAGFTKMGGDFAKTIEQLKEIENKYSNLNELFDKKELAPADYGKRLGEIAEKKAGKISESSSFIEDMKSEIEKNPTSDYAKHLDEKEKVYGQHVEKMFALQALFEQDMRMLSSKKEAATSEDEKKRYEQVTVARSDSHQKSLFRMMAENVEFSEMLGKDLDKLSKSAQKEAIKESRIALKGIRALIKKEKKGVNSNLPETKAEIETLEKSADDLEEKINKLKPKEDLSKAFKSVSDAFKTSADAVRHFNAPLADSLEIVSGIAGGAAEIAGGFAMMGANPIQGVAGIAKGVMGVVGMFAKRNAENIAIKKAYEEQQTQIYSKELEYHKLLRERLLLEKQIGQTTSEYHGSKSKELGEQKVEIAKEYNDVFRKLQQEEYISELEYIHKTWFRKASTKKHTASLKGKNYDELEALYAVDKLEGEAKILFERLKALKEEGQNVDKMLQQLEEEMKQTWTGTTADSIFDSIAKGFTDGLRSAEDFASSFEDMMKKALLQSLKMKFLEKDLQAWYEKFAKYSESDETLSAEEIAELQKEYNDIIESAIGQIEAFEELTQINFKKEEKVNTETVAQKGLAAMTQDSADELNGRFTALQMITDHIDGNVTGIHSILYKAAAQWVEIAENTSHCRRLESIENDMNSMKSDINTIALKGIRLLR